jgi:prepilin-type N-terminal cleavage/methylation domain-containing protein
MKGIVTHPLKQTNSKHSGFTIVELLIVIVVIAILAAISIVAYNGIQQRARDSTRKSDINNLAKLLELHYVDRGSYTQPENRATDYSTDGTNDWAADSDLRDLITGGYTSKLPVDPTNNATYYYSYEPWNAGDGSYATAGLAYDLCARLEQGGNYCVNKRT